MNNIELLKTQQLSDFPSGSSINNCDNLLYLIGDDANTILILDKEYVKVGSVQLFNYPGKRIPKPMKSDLEASAFITVDALDYLLIIGSGSTHQREKVILVPFTQNKLHKAEALRLSTNLFIDRLRSMGITEINIEGATVMGEILLMSNRGNRKNETNHIIFTSIDFWKHQASATIKIVPLKIMTHTDDILGVSEICYAKEIDTLLISFSSEKTDNAYDDGTIGHSHIGWIQNFTQKVHEPDLVVNHTINLSTVSKEFKNEKIEGLCIESIIGQEVVLHLIADNDTGQSALFKIRMTVRG